jgi:carboxylesterase
VATALGIVVAIVALAGGAVWLARTRSRRLYETSSHRTPAGGTRPGAEPVELGQGSRGVLILHGFGDTPQSIRALATRLHLEGWSVRAPLLPGHGRSLDAFTKARADEWEAAAREALAALQRQSSHVAIVGQSMGGALATTLAADTHIEALVLLVPFMTLSRRGRRIAAFHRLVSIFAPYLVSRSESSILDPEARRKALGRGITTPRLVRELSVIVDRARKAAPRVTAPTLVIHSRQDPRVTTADAESVFDLLGPAEKSLLWVDRSGHVISVDFDRDVVAQRVSDWLGSHAGGA